MAVFVLTYAVLALLVISWLSSIKPSKLPKIQAGPDLKKRYESTSLRHHTERQPAFHVA